VPSVRRDRLDNGLTVIASRRTAVPLVELRLRIPVPPPTRAADLRRRLLAKTMLSGTSTADATTVARRLQAIGGSLAVSIGADSMTISGSALAARLDDLLALLAEVIADAAYPRGRVINERTRLAQELVLQHSQPGTIVGAAMRRRLYGRHPYGLPLPDIDSLGRVGPGTLRTVHAALVTPAEAALVVVGDVRAGRVVEAVERHLGGWSGADVAVSAPEPRPPRPGPVWLIDRPGALQTNIRVAGPVPDRGAPGFPALELAQFVLGGYFSSRISLNLREDKGYGYSPRSAIEHRRAASRFTVVADVATEVTGAALNEIRYELGRMTTTSVPVEELDAARRYRTGTLAMSVQTQAGLASQLHTLTFAGLDERYLRDHPRAMAQVTAEAMIDASRAHLAPEQLVTVMLGDAAVIGAQIDGLARVEIID
jgi:predicted Zn-dependent peptidase